LTAAEKETTRTLASNLEKLTALSDKNAINKAIQELNEFTTPLAHRSMDKTILEAMKGKKV
jgi:molecular chaperone HscA